MLGGWGEFFKHLHNPNPQNTSSVMEKSSQAKLYGFCRDELETTFGDVAARNTSVFARTVQVQQTEFLLRLVLYVLHYEPLERKSTYDTLPFLDVLFQDYGVIILVSHPFRSRTAKDGFPVHHHQGDICVTNG